MFFYIDEHPKGCSLPPYGSRFKDIFLKLCHIHRGRERSPSFLYVRLHCKKSADKKPNTAREIISTKTKLNHSPQVCLIFTDGWPQDPMEIPAASKAWSDNGITVFAIGIGRYIGRKSLTEIAGAEERALHVKNVRAISGLAESLLKKVCAVGKCRSKSRSWWLKSRRL